MDRHVPGFSQDDSHAHRFAALYPAVSATCINLSVLLAPLKTPASASSNILSPYFHTICHSQKNKTPDQHVLQLAFHVVATPIRTFSSFEYSLVGFLSRPVLKDPRDSRPNNYSTSPVLDHGRGSLCLSRLSPPASSCIQSIRRHCRPFFSLDPLNYLPYSATRQVAHRRVFALTARDGQQDSPTNSIQSWHAVRYDGPCKCRPVVTPWPWLRRQANMTGDMYDKPQRLFPHAWCYTVISFVIIPSRGCTLCFNTFPLVNSTMAVPFHGTLAQGYRCILSRCVHNEAL